MKIILLCLMLLPSYLFSEENISQDNVDTPESNNKKIFVSFQYGKGKTKTDFDETGSIGIRKQGLEYRLIPELGFGLSLNNSKANYESKPNQQFALGSLYLGNQIRQSNPNDPNLKLVGAMAIISVEKAIW